MHPLKFTEEGEDGEPHAHKHWHTDWFYIVSTRGKVKQKNWSRLISFPSSLNNYKNILDCVKLGKDPSNRMKKMCNKDRPWPKFWRIRKKKRKEDFKKIQCWRFEMNRRSGHVHKQKSSLLRSNYLKWANANGKRRTITEENSNDFNSTPRNKTLAKVLL